MRKRLARPVTVRSVAVGAPASPALRAPIQPFLLQLNLEPDQGEFRVYVINLDLKVSGRRLAARVRRAALGGGPPTWGLLACWCV